MTPFLLFAFICTVIVLWEYHDRKFHEGLKDMWPKSFEGRKTSWEDILETMKVHNDKIARRPSPFRHLIKDKHE